MAHLSSLPLPLPPWAGMSGAGRLLQAQVHEQSDMHCQRQHQRGCGCVPLLCCWDESRRASIAQGRAGRGGAGGGGGGGGGPTKRHGS